MNGLFHIVRGLMDGRFTTYVQGIRDGFHEPLTVWDNKSIDDKRKPDGTRAKDRSIKP